MAICDARLIKFCQFSVIFSAFLSFCDAGSISSHNNDISIIDGLHLVDGSAACLRRQFRCSNGKCIQYKWICDGEAECEDGSDESTAVCNRTCTQDEFRCSSGHCIPKEYVCDKEAECHDGSDEDSDHCEDLLDKCDPGQFYCGPGTCVPETWKCDGKKDCPNGLDEAHCRTTCPPSEFSCGNGACIDKKYVCDGDEDCYDGRDEKECDTECKSDDFKCHSESKCVARSWMCDGYEDCVDGSDEKDCVYPEKVRHSDKQCTNNEWPCADRSTCVLTAWLCDGRTDCRDGSDEAPSLCSNLTCRADQFQCNNRQCIPGYKQCDRENDCFDNSDEEDCEEKRPSCSEEEFDCGEGMCLPMTNVCDGKSDCPGFEDEPRDLCNVNECSHNNGGCSHECVDDKIGYHCTCRKGFALVGNSTCEDVDECKDPGACSHVCINTVGGFRCECFDGYLQPPTDETFCKAMHGPGSLIFTKRQDIRKLNLDNLELTSIVDHSKAAGAMDFVYKTRTIFWMEGSNGTIYKAPIDAGFHKTAVVTDVVKCDGLAVDWIYDHIYWTDAEKNTLEVADFDGRSRKTLFRTGLDEPRSVAVNPSEGWLFWSDWGSNAKIERAGMDGNHRSVIVSHNVLWPNGITLDLVRHKIYWVDAKLSLMSSANFDGSGRRSVLRSKDTLHHPHSLSVFEDTVFWVDWGEQTIYKANKFDGRYVEKVLAPSTIMHDPMVVHVFHPYKQNSSINHCETSSHRCSHLCFPAPRINERSPKITCACPDGMRLGQDSTVCVEETPSTSRPTTKHSQSTVDVHETVVDIELEPEQSSGFVAVVFVLIATILVLFFAAVLYFVYRQYINKNETSINFENFVYKKTTTTGDNQYSKKSATNKLYSPPSAVLNDELRIPLNDSPTSEIP